MISKIGLVHERFHLRNIHLRRHFGLPQCYDNFVGVFTSGGFLVILNAMIIVWLHCLWRRIGDIDLTIM